MAESSQYHIQLYVISKWTSGHGSSTRLIPIAADKVQKKKTFMLMFYILLFYYADFLLSIAVVVLCLFFTHIVSSQINIFMSYVYLLAV